MATPEAPEKVAERGRSRWRLVWVVVLVVVVAIAGVVLWQVFSGEDSPTVTFDGETAIYSGPATLEAGTVTVTFENTHDETVSLAWGRISDESVTMADAEQFYEATATPDDLDNPPYMGEVRSIGSAVPGSAVDYDATLTEGKYELFVLYDARSRIYPAVHIAVTGS